MTKSSSPSREAIMYLIHHIFLPPMLPQKDDFNFKHEQVLLDCNIDCLEKFKSYVSPDHSRIVESVRATIATLRTVHDSINDSGAVNERELVNSLKNLCKKGGTIAINIRTQNAGVMISKVEKSIHIEAFELTPLNQAVITTKGRLRRSFPGPAFALSMEIFAQSEFQATLAHTLAKMSRQRAADTKPKVKKSGKMHEEDRDTTHPKMVTELLMGFLRSLAEPVSVSRLWKNTREEVMWFDSLLPWHRSSMWLLVRVAMQLGFSRSKITSNSPGDLYKMFMIFLMSQVLDLSCPHKLPPDLMYAMNARLARRFLKLGTSADGPGLDIVQGIMRNTNELIKEKLSKITEEALPRFDLSRLKNLDSGQDINHSLLALDEYVNSIAQRENSKSSVVSLPSSGLVKYPADRLPTNLDGAIEGYTAYNLKAFETWVASHLSSWLKLHKGNSSTCDEIGSLIRKYHSVACPFYSDNVEATSSMLLTILELWIACDISATHHCELLKDYDPGIPLDIFQSFVLPFKSQMKRLSCGEDFLNNRRTRSRYAAPSIFLDFGTQECFSVKYFRTSYEHQILLTKIENQATADRQAKCGELLQKKAEYKSLMQLYDQSECEYYEVVTDYVNDFREQRHSGSCKRCGYESRAAAIDIQIYEWPLPDKPLEAQSTVFELRVPPSFGCWRDTTIFVLLDVLRSEYMCKESPRSAYSPQMFNGLASSFHPYSSTQRIGLLSQDKPHMVTHRRVKSIPDITENDICLQNGLHYQYYDSRTKYFVDRFSVTDEIPNFCTYKLPTRSSALQQFLYRPASMPNGPSPNTVIASQSDCPDHLSLDEYKALSVIPLGYRVQWPNILLQLSMPSVDFKKVETGLVILQSIYQAGPPSPDTILRSGHEIVDDLFFVNALLDALHEALQRVKENWESSQALCTFISLATRLLSLTSREEIQRQYLDFLADIRFVAFGWVNLIRDKAHDTTNEGQRADLLSKAVEIALICVYSFHVDKEYLEDILARPKDASVFIQCCIFIQEGERPLTNTSDAMISILHWRWKWLSYCCYPILTKEILNKRHKFLDDAIKKSWSAYEAGGGWRTASDQADHWFVSCTSPKGNNGPLWVHLDILTGELLVNGHPLARLPSKYEHHPAYHILFSHSALEVMPSAIRGMEFSGKKDYAGYTLHFGIGPTSDNCSSPAYDLLVRAVKGDKAYELIPSRVFRNVVPVAFANDFVHWYDIKDKCVEFRPIEDPWTSFSENWRLTRTSTGSKWQLKKNGVSLVGVNSETGKVLSDILNSLEDRLWIHTILHHSSSLLEILLPRLQLGFYLQSGASSIRSRQFRGMSIDANQSLGTLVGLHSKLMLKHENDGTRIVVLPEGSVSYQKNEDHIRVDINKNSVIRAHAYYVDGQIGRLVDNGSLQSQLFLCYLHALTSFCLPDPLIYRTGTEQALSILNSAAVRSFDRLSQENVEILDQIARLTPERKYYPANERVMQTVHWSTGLGFLAQHGRFYKLVRQIFRQAERTKIFYPETYVEPPKSQHVESDLLERDLIRSSTFRVSGFGAEDHTVEHDATYDARDPNQDSDQGFRAFIMSSVIYQRRPTLHYDVSFSLASDLWDVLSDTDKILGGDHVLPFSELKYDAGLLLESSEFFSQNWCPLHRTLSEADPRFDRFQLMIWLSTLAFAQNADMQILQILASFFALTSMAYVHIPEIDCFQLGRGYEFKKHELRQGLRSALYPLNQCPEANLTRQRYESNPAFHARRQRQFQSNRDSSVETLLNALGNQWPCEIPSNPPYTGSVGCSVYINVNDAIESAKPRIKTWFDNYQFRKYINQVVDALKLLPVIPIGKPSSSFTTPLCNVTRRPGFISIYDVLDCPAPTLSRGDIGDLANLCQSNPNMCMNTPRLSTLIEPLKTLASSKYEKKYIDDLQGSLHSLQKLKNEKFSQPEGANVKRLLWDHLHQHKIHVEKAYEAILSAITASHEANGRTTSGAATRVKQWPRVSPIFFLQLLTRTWWKKITAEWKECVVTYGRALAELQRAERLVSAVGSPSDLIKELGEPGHANWDPLEYPESLLLEVESGIIIREAQEQIAQNMRDPPSGKNTVMQLNMGEGKSSVIVPIVATALADGSRLVRVIVAKPQSKQMFQMLLSKLGGLLDRRIYHMPFSRALRPSEAEADAMGYMCRECMINGGILLVQPEHILSFKLMGIECLISGKPAVGRSLLSTQDFFDTSSRDIVDESDENFSVKFELIYTMGEQGPIELSPERWICIQQVLDLVRSYAPRVKSDYPLSIDVHERCPGSFPRTRILKPDAQQQIFNYVAKHICQTNLNGFPIARQPKSVRQAVFRYITEPELAAEEVAEVENQGPGGFWSDTTKSTLLLLRGLIGGGVLAFAFGQKRWRVNYGLVSTRQPNTKLAVPYRAKDNPTTRSEFSHPDVVIVLTCLSYYYSGLGNDDLFLAFGHLLKSDQADVEYQAWVSDAPNLPVSFHQLVGINLKDHLQCLNQAFPPLRYAKGVVDYFLAHIVFPKEMKEFPHKLSASGWDIGQVKTHPTTGFSGTNDSQKVLPLSVEHLDLPEQNHTNALVLEYLLQSENSVLLMAPWEETSSSDAAALLAMVTKIEPPVQVILDVGAQILELGNLAVAREWLKLMPDRGKVQAVVYFDDSDELYVVDHKGRIEPLQISSFAKQLDVCLVYLDEAHTRGTDLKLPEYYRAAVTLGANLTKDRLVQACMRMRKLGKGQSVAICVPEEIKTKLLARISKPRDSCINVSDVLSWAISETHIDIRRNLPLWAVQGRRFQHQSAIWNEARTNGRIDMSKSQAKQFLENEAQSLEDRYRPHSPTNMTPFAEESMPENLNLIIERCREFDSLEFNSATLQEEQERELSPEIEQERQVQKPPQAQPALHRIHPDLKKFVSTGILDHNSEAYLPAFKALYNTSAATHINVSQFPGDLLVTADFDRTIQITGVSYLSDWYQRPVQWVLTDVGTHTSNSNPMKHMIIISPYEAQALLPEIRNSKTATLHLYAPRPKLGFRALDRLDLYTVPARPKETFTTLRSLVVQLNSFAGQLYLGSYSEYVELCHFLGLAWENVPDSWVVAADGFILQGDHGFASEIANRCMFIDSPVKFLKVLMTKIRRNCEAIDKTHVGKVLDGKILRLEDFGEAEGLSAKI